MREVKIGDKTHCVECGQEVVITEKTFVLTPESEIVICPHCGKSADVFKYLHESDPKPIIEQQEIIRFCGRWVLKLEYTLGDQKRYAVLWLK